MLILLLVLLAAILWFGVRPRLPEPDHALLESSPTRCRTPSTPSPSWPRCTSPAAGCVSWMTVEKIVLVGLMSAIYGLFLPTVRRPRRSCSSRSACLVAVNAAITILFSRREWTIESARAWPSLVRVVGQRRAGRSLFDFVFDRDSAGWTTFFFLCLISLVTTLHDRYQPVYAWRRSRELDLRDS